MSLVKYGGGIIQMSGSIAGNTFARNRYGNYVRARTKPVNPKTALQTAIRSAMAALTTRWSATLTANQRTAWNLYASNVAMKNRLGEVINLTGFNHYIRSNAIREMVGPAPIDDGPVVFELPAADPTLAVTASEAAQTLSITFDNALDWSVEDGAFMWFFQGQPQNAQRNFFAGPWRHVQSVEGADPAGAVSPTIPAVVFATSEGQRIWIYARIQRADGRLSEVFRADTFCAA